MGKEVFNQEYINNFKSGIGYADDSPNITVQNNPHTFGKFFLFGIFASFGLRMYNLSFEKDGLLFIQRSTTNNKLLEDKINFISHDEITSINYRQGMLQNKLIITDQKRNKLVFKINKLIRTIDWHKDSLSWMEQQYG